MLCNRKYFVGAAFLVLGLAPVFNSAYAACRPLAGVWNFYAMEVTPTQPNGWTASALQCEMAVAVGGYFTASCSAYNVLSSTPETASLTGNLDLLACNLSGTISIPSESSIIIRGGHINGDFGSGIATQGLDVMHFSMVRRY